MLTRSRVAAAALEVFSAGGLAGLTMRAVAAELDVTVRALYRYVDDRRDLLAVVAVEFQQRLPRITATGDLRDDLERHATELRRLFAGYPEAMAIGLVEGVMPASTAFYESNESVMRLLVDHGLGVDDAYLAVTALVRDAWSIVSLYDRGVAAAGVSGGAAPPVPASNEPDAVGATVDAERFPLSAGATPRTGDEFARHALTLLLDWVDSRIAAATVRCDP